MAKRNSRSARKRAGTPEVRAAVGAPVVEVIRESRPRKRVNQDDVLDTQHTGVAYSAGRSSFYSGTRVLPNPDQVLAAVGGVRDCGFYEDMLLRHPWLAGIVDQRVEKANRDRVIVAGDPSVPRSVELADLARQKFRRVQWAKMALGRALRNGRFIGPGGLEKVYTRDPDGLVYPCRLIDRPPKSIKFRNDGTALWLSQGRPYDGEEIPRRKMMFIRGGSLNTPYGEVELAHVYASTYIIEKAVELMLDAIEEFGRPIPVIYMPKSKDMLTAAERTQLRAYAAAVHSRFVEVPTNETNARIDIGGNTLAASGQVGRPELSIIETMITWCYIRILRITQTLNKTGGSRALEEVRYNITDDASRPDSNLIDDSLNALSVVGDEYTGWMSDFNDFNFPDDPEEILPRFETPTLSGDEISAFHKMTMDAVDRGMGADLSKEQYLRVTGQEKAKNDADKLGGTPMTRVTKTQTDDLDQPNTGRPREIPRPRDDGEPESLADLAAMANSLTQKLDAMVGV